MRCRFRHTLSDIVELNRYAFEQRVKGWVAAGVAVMVAFVGTLVWIRDGEFPGVVYFIAALFLGMSLGGTRLAGLGAWIRTPKIEGEFEIDDRGVEYLHCNGPQIDWRAMSRWFTTPNLIVLAVPGDMIAIPRRCFDDVAWNELLDTIRRNLGDPARG